MVFGRATKGAVKGSRLGLMRLLLVSSCFFRKEQVKNKGDFSYLIFQTCAKIFLELGSKDYSIFRTELLTLQPNWRWGNNKGGLFFCISLESVICVNSLVSSLTHLSRSAWQHGMPAAISRESCLLWFKLALAEHWWTMGFCSKRPDTFPIQFSPSPSPLYLLLSLVLESPSL